MNNDNVKSIRLKSLDALRGFDMIWIIGAGVLLRNLCLASDVPWLNSLAVQFTHVKWEGLHAFDLIFPLFVFLSGISIPYAITGKLKRGTSKKILTGKIIKRVVVLFLLGLVYIKILQFDGAFKSRGQSVLGLIGVAYGIAALIFLYSKKIYSPLIWMFSLLIAYSLVQWLVPVPGYGAGVFSRSGSINTFIDETVIGTFDSEGILCMISASIIALAGVVTGQIVRNPSVQEYQKFRILITSGVIFIGIASVASLWYPVIKNLWTTTFDLYAIGISLLLFSLFYLIIDIWKFQRWAFFLNIIGMNSITIYMGAKLINFRYTSEFILGGIASHVGGHYATAIILVGVLVLEWLCLYYLYKNKIFLKV